MDKTKIVSSRIKEARESCGLSMGELSEIIGVTSSAISDYEKGKINPTMRVLTNMAYEFGLPIHFFYKPYDTYTCDNSAVYFRSMKTTPKKIKTAYAHRVPWAHSINEFLSKFVEFTPLEFPKLPENYDPEYLDDNAIENIALFTRKQLALGDRPIKNMTDLIEGIGAFVCGIAFKNRKIDAFSQWYNGTPYIFLGSHRTSCVALRFSIAHELGHLLLHTHISMAQIFEKKILDRIEDEANKFAAAFLMPADSFSNDIFHTSLDYFVMLKEKWKVSLSAMIRRSNNLGLLSENQTNYLHRQMSIRKFWQAEPLDDLLPMEQPCAFKEAFDIVVDNGIQSKKDIIEGIALSDKEITTICSLDDNYFNEVPSKVSRVSIRIV